MANAELKTVEPVPPPDEVILVLSMTEAVALQTVLQCVGGSPSGMRGNIDEIVTALDGIEIDPLGYGIALMGSVFFRDEAGE